MNSEQSYYPVLFWKPLSSLALHSTRTDSELRERERERGFVKVPDFSQICVFDVFVRNAYRIDAKFGARLYRAII